MNAHATPAEACSGSALGLLFRQTRDAMWGRMAKELADAGHDLTFSQFIAIKKLATGTAGVTDLARAADLNPGAMTRLLDKLEALGCVRREPHAQDRRALQIVLTDEGRALHARLKQRGDEVMDYAMRDLSPDERALLMSLLTRIRDSLTPP